MFPRANIPSPGWWGSLTVKAIKVACHHRNGTWRVPPIKSMTKKITVNNGKNGGHLAPCVVSCWPMAFITQSRQTQFEKRLHAARRRTDKC